MEVKACMSATHSLVGCIYLAIPKIQCLFRQFMLEKRVPVGDCDNIYQ